MSGYVSFGTSKTRTIQVKSLYHMPEQELIDRQPDLETGNLPVLPGSIKLLTTAGNRKLVAKIKFDGEEVKETENSRRGDEMVKQKICTVPGYPYLLKIEIVKPIKTVKGPKYSYLVFPFIRGYNLQTLVMQSPPEKRRLLILAFKAGITHMAKQGVLYGSPAFRNVITKQSGGRLVFSFLDWEKVYFYKTAADQNKLMQVFLEALRQSPFLTPAEKKLLVGNHFSLKKYLDTKLKSHTPLIYGRETDYHNRIFPGNPKTDEQINDGDRNLLLYERITLMEKGKFSHPAADNPVYFKETIHRIRDILLYCKQSTAPFYRLLYKAGLKAYITKDYREKISVYRQLYSVLLANIPLTEVCEKVNEICNKNRTLIIDASHGEGGGQIIRCALFFSILNHQPALITNIRRHRKEPGLRRAHVANNELISKICSAKTKGNLHGSRQMYFSPGPAKPGDYVLNPDTYGGHDILAGTVVQSLIPFLIFTNKPSRITIAGSTHKDGDLPIEHVLHSQLPLLAQMGIRAKLRVLKYERGSHGKIRLTIYPLTEKLKTPVFTNRGKLKEVVIRISHTHGSGYDIKSLSQKLKVQFQMYPVKIRIKKESLQTDPGSNIQITVILKFTNSQTCFSQNAGQTDVLIKDIKEHLEIPGKVDKYALDSLVPFMALAPGISQVTCPVITPHAKTCMQLTEQFLPVKFDIQPLPSKAILISCKGVGKSPVTLKSERDMAGEVFRQKIYSIG